MNREVWIIAFAALLQGICLVSFPAASTLLTGEAFFGFSATSYGSLFLPQAVLSILGALSHPFLNRRFSSQTIFILGLICNLWAMALFFLSSWYLSQPEIAYSLLLMATGGLGLGFGLTVPTLNSMSVLIYPHNVDAALLLLNALLGVGTAAAPLGLYAFAAIGHWWGFPLMLALLLVALLLLSFQVKLPGGRLPRTRYAVGAPIPHSFWLFALFALFYGFIETMTGNWVSIYMGKVLSAGSDLQALALALFWAMVTCGRVLFALLKRYINEVVIYRLSPFLVAIAFFCVAWVPLQQAYLALGAFALAGLGCAALLPLTLSLGCQKYSAITASVPAIVIACYLMGYGLSAFGLGPLQERGDLSLRAIFALGSALALLLGALAIMATHTSLREQKNMP